MAKLASLRLNVVIAMVHKANLFILVLAVFVVHLSHVAALECYVCTNQEDNVEKCLNTIKTCDYGQDVCSTEIKWGSTPYWSQGAKKQYYISKRCSTKVECAATRMRYMPFCTNIWYQDWACSDCCQGDRCNYYVINGSETRKFSKVFLITIFFITFISLS